jgi:uncharacterized membrane protein
MLNSLFFSVLGFELARQVLYHLGHKSNSFFSALVILVLFAQADYRLQSFY